MTKVYNIGVEATLEVIGGKWKPVILCHLREDKKRTGELKRLIPNITQKMLTQQLRELEKSGVIVRKVYEQIPPKVEYSLSEYGESLSEILNKLCLWGENHVDLLLTKNEDIVLLNRD
ncbi:transcriptional regulator [Listeria monocytogenes]|nr:transcriptional regulator [Listeria monocytogenes]EAE7067069.1 transcriptional regulator [Listeria monocytogenes]EAG1402500.1 transcriptional regulator [Listeria monocytogenes]EBF5153454.1 helix-turn-helix transcriptional regulator [Listeria monocytogenes]EBF5170714.1 helix-turn-helix transcriptional regulator [Listeria monocytogenes]